MIETWRQPLGELGLRTLGGSLVGYTWCQTASQSALRGALLGGLGAAAATFGWYQLRKAITEKSGLLPAAVGLGEDALLWGAGAVLLRSLPLLRTGHSQA